MTEIKTVKVETDGFQCLRCGYCWIPRNKDKPPKVCAGCNSPYWMKPRREKKEGE
jgi:hypothetical protein